MLEHVSVTCDQRCDTLGALPPPTKPRGLVTLRVAGSGQVRSRLEEGWGGVVR
jgi:hypothetical protein